jgi:hypothetical protein
MPNPLQDRIRIAMTDGGDLDLVLDQALNGRAPGSQQVYLHDVGNNAIRIDLSNDGEPATILWLPWRQGTLQVLQPASIERAAAGSLFLTYYLSGCKLFAVQGGPVWHIDAQVSVAEFWPEIQGNEWVEDNWPAGTVQDVAYLHRAGQDPALWDLSAQLQGGPPATYGNGNVGQALVGGVVGGGQLALYFKASPWAGLSYGPQQLKK